MKSEELRRYEEEFRAMREMLGTYYLELALRPVETEATGAPDPDAPSQSADPDPPPGGDGSAAGPGRLPRAD
jgi:hypothetical protein